MDGFHTNPPQVWGTVSQSSMSRISRTRLTSRPSCLTIWKMSTALRQWPKLWTSTPRPDSLLLKGKVLEFVCSRYHFRSSWRIRQLFDGANQRPHYSLRTLGRVLSYVRAIHRKTGLGRALHDGAVMAFATQLSETGWGGGSLAVLWNIFLLISVSVIMHHAWMI